MSDTSIARVQLADFGIQLGRAHQKPIRVDEPVDLRERNVSIELWMLAALFASMVVFTATLAGNKPQTAPQLVAERVMTPIKTAAVASPSALPITELEPVAVIGEVSAPDVGAANTSASGTLQVNAPEGAIVDVDGRRIGKAPVAARRVTAGTHDITIKHGGIELNDVATVPANQTISYDIAFNFTVE